MKVTPQQLRPASKAERTLLQMDLTTAQILSSSAEDVTEQLRLVEDLTEEREMLVEPEVQSPDDELDNDETEPFGGAAYGRTSSRRCVLHHRRRRAALSHQPTRHSRCLHRHTTQGVSHTRHHLKVTLTRSTSCHLRRAARSMKRAHRAC